jgi:hypothetical protein
MRILKPALCCLIAAIIPVLFVSCKKKGPTDLADLSIIVASQKGKDYMDIVHRTHDRAGIICEKCHHRYENPDRLKICSNCHRGEEKRIARDMCVRCHTGDGK